MNQTTVTETILIPMINITSREREILNHIAYEKTSKEIAQELNIAVETVLSHRRNIMEKMKVRNVAGLIRVAMKQQLID